MPGKPRNRQFSLACFALSSRSAQAMFTRFANPHIELPVSSGQYLMHYRSEIASHASRKSCWAIINGSVYDLTSFLGSHPGGSSIILKYAGQDATHAFESIHSSDILEKYLAPQYVYLLFSISYDQRREFTHSCFQRSTNLGRVIEPLVPAKQSTTPDHKIVSDPSSKKPRLGPIISIRDFEQAASQILPPRSFACKLLVQTFVSSH